MHRLFRLIPLAALLLVLLGGALAEAALPAAPLKLRAAVVVTDKVIRLADLFEGELANGATPIAQAPAPGGSVVLDARWLLAVARAFDLPWQPASRFEQVVVGRASRDIDAPQIKETLRAAIAERGVDGDFDIEFDLGELTLHLPTDVAPTTAVQMLNYDQRSGRFNATVVAPADGPVAASRAVSGRVYALAEVPVPARRLLPGEVIGQDDLQWVKLRADRIGANIVTDLAQLVGKSPRRPIRADEPIRGSDLGTAVAIKRNSLVTMILQTPEMTLTVQGRALEDGALGDTVRVVNTKSNRVINAQILDSGTVVVGAATLGGDPVASN